MEGLVASNKDKRFQPAPQFLSSICEKDNKSKDLHTNKRKEHWKWNRFASKKQILGAQYFLMRSSYWGFLEEIHASMKDPFPAIACRWENLVYMIKIIFIYQKLGHSMIQKHYFYSPTDLCGESLRNNIKLDGDLSVQLIDWWCYMNAFSLNWL